MSCLVTGLHDGLVDIKGDIIQLKEILASNVPEVELLQSYINDLDSIIRDLSDEDDERFVSEEVIYHMDSIDWERFQTKIMIILEQTYQVIGLLCRSTKSGIVEVEIKKYK